MNFCPAINGLTTGISLPLTFHRRKLVSIRFLWYFFYPSFFYLQRLPRVRSNWTQFSFFSHFDNFFFDMATRPNCMLKFEKAFWSPLFIPLSSQTDSFGGRNVAAACTIHNPHTPTYSQIVLTIMRIIQIDDLFPSVKSNGIDNGLMVVRSHANGEIQESRWRC